MNMIAHIRKMDNTAQPLAEHCRTVGALCAKAGRKIGLEKTAQLTDSCMTWAKQPQILPHTL